MLLNTDGMKPIYVQIAEWLEAEILSGNIKEDERIYSQYQLADMFNINPATAAKGLNILADENVVYKKRGLGMLVSLNEKKTILEKRKGTGLNTMIIDLLNEAKQLNISENELIDMIKNEIKKMHESEASK